LNKTLLVQTVDRGEHWTAIEPLDVFNPNAGLTAVRRNNGDLLLVFNNSPDQRDVLSLAISRDNGQSWSVIHDFENHHKPPLNRFSYPLLIQAANGHYHLMYTWNRQYIKHVEFNEAWLEARL
jgi:predicted neuraminidase